MKKIFVVLLAITVLALSACQSAKDPTTEEKDNEVKALSKNENYLGGPLEEFSKIIEKARSQNDSTDALNIPVYREDDLFFETEGQYWLGRDAYTYAGQSARQNDANGIYACYPTEAIRVKEDGRAYTVYDSDSGYRMFLFFDKENGYTTPVGFPVVIKDLLPFSDFQDIQPGDPIEKVEQIDPVASLYKKLMMEVWNLNTIASEKYAEDGHPLSSIHYLKDGLLRFEYALQEDGELLITNIKFYSDYTVPSDPSMFIAEEGKPVCYEIEEIDLP